MARVRGDSKEGLNASSLDKDDVFVLPSHLSTGGGSRRVSESAFVYLDNAFVLIEDSAPWLAQYVHELATFPNGKHDDQADSTSQALDWMKSFPFFEPPIVQFYRKEAEKRKAEQQRTEPDPPPRLTREWYYRTHGMR